MPKQVTLKSLLEETMKKLCAAQNYGAAAIVRDMVTAIDPSGSKKLTEDQVKTVKAFLNTVIETAYS